MAYCDQGTRSLTLVAGTAALSASTPQAAQASRPTANHPHHGFFRPTESESSARVHRRDSNRARRNRGLVFLADGSGIWILRQRLAMDPRWRRPTLTTCIITGSRFRDRISARRPAWSARFRASAGTTSAGGKAAETAIRGPRSRRRGRYAEVFAEIDRRFSAVNGPHGRR